MSDWGFETRAIHEGADPKDGWGATSVPIYQNAAFAHPGAQELQDVFAGSRQGYLYSRISNPTVTAFERKITALERGVGAIAVSSGMAAITTVALSLTGQGGEIVSSTSIFGGTLHLFRTLLARYGVLTRFVDPADLDSVRSAMGARTRMLFVETIGNPKIDVPDIASLAGVAAERGVPLVVDGTVSTPYLFPARDHGAAVVVHSATKYMASGGSTIGGVIVDLGTFDWSIHPEPLLKEAARRYGKSLAFLAATRKSVLQNTGACLAPMSAWLESSGLETLALRMERHCSNAMELAAALEAHPGVEEVSYPGLASSPYRCVADRQFGGKFGAIMAVRLGSRERCFRLVGALRLARNLANLGDSRTLVIHPASTIYADCNDAERREAGVTDDLLRVSVGIESPKDILRDFAEALDSLDSRVSLGGKAKGA